MLEIALASAISSVAFAWSTSRNSISRPELVERVRLEAVDRPSHFWAKTLLINQIDELEALPEGWDGEDAERIPSAIAESARAFLRSYEGPSPSIFPNVSGTLLLEWESPLGVAVLEIGLTRYSFYVNPQNGEPRFRKNTVDALVADVDELTQLVGLSLNPAKNGGGRTIANIRMGMTFDERLAA